MKAQFFDRSGAIYIIAFFAKYKPSCNITACLKKQKFEFPIFPANALATTLNSFPTTATRIVPVFASLISIEQNTQKNLLHS